MENISKKLHLSLSEFIVLIAKRKPGSWLSLGLEDYFQCDQKVSDIKEALKICLKKSHKFPKGKLIIFPEPYDEIPQEWGITSPQMFYVDELQGIVEESVSLGCTNYYIVPNKFPPSWAIILCHEGDVHFQGSAANWLTE